MKKSLVEHNIWISDQSRKALKQSRPVKQIRRVTQKSRHLSKGCTLTQSRVCSTYSEKDGLCEHPAGHWVLDHSALMDLVDRKTSLPKLKFKKVGGQDLPTAPQATTSRVNPKSPLDVNFMDSLGKKTPPAQSYMNLILIKLGDKHLHSALQATPSPPPPVEMSLEQPMDINSMSHPVQQTSILDIESFAAGKIRLEVRIGKSYVPLDLGSANNGNTLKRKAPANLQLSDSDDKLEPLEDSERIDNDKDKNEKLIAGRGRTAAPRRKRRRVSRSQKSGNVPDPEVTKSQKSEQWQQLAMYLRK